MRCVIKYFLYHSIVSTWHVFSHQVTDLYGSPSSLREQYPVLLLTSDFLIRTMIGLDIPRDSHIKDQNTNGLLSARWQSVVWVYNLAVISSNLMNQITIIHRYKSFSSGINCPLCPRAERNERVRTGRWILFFRGWQKRREDWREIIL